MKKCWLYLLALCVALTGLLSTQQAHAFCGFYVSGADSELYNDATQVVLMRDGTTTVLSMRNHYSGPPEDFAMVVPVPVVLQKENVNTLSHDIFEKVDTLTSPRLVEYWRTDPCSMWGYAMGGGAGGGMGGVKIEAQFEVGEYQIVILSADDSMGLTAWLKSEKYNIPAGAEGVLKGYVDAGMKFFVARVNVKKVKRVNGRAVLSPLRFFYESETFSLPVRLGLLNAKGPQDLIIHILAKNQRSEVANMPNVTIPTNIEVHDSVRKHFGEFYTTLFDQTLEKNPGAVVTEYSWNAASCDPCPGPTLGTQDFVDLGADVIPSGARTNFVLTRLHARYTSAQLKDDLIFKAAPPISGGRERYGREDEEYTQDHPSHLEEGAKPSSINNFQARYIIRHPWTGAVCEQPAGIQWGSKEGGHGDEMLENAKDTAFVERKKKASITQWLAEDVPELGLKAKRKRVTKYLPTPKE